MSSKFDGYVFDIAYDNNFYRDLTPNQIEAALMFHGVALPTRTQDDPLCYLELGFGQGLSLNVHAAACEGEFWGTDFNPNHCVAAENLSKAANTKCHFFNDSFEELYTKSENGLLPQFDIISLHGVWSWISQESRNAVLRLISRNLKAGGAVYVSYNCMPGWANFAPLRELLTYHAKSQSSTKDSKVQVQDAYNFVAQLEKNNALFFNANPGSIPKLKSIETKSISYIAHEYFNEDWYVPYFKDVAAEFEQARCSFVASTRPLSQINIGLSAEQNELLASIDDRNLRETTRDFILNTQFRTDIYVKGKNPLTVEQRNDTCFALSTHQENVNYEINNSISKLQLKEDFYKPVVEFIASDDYKPKSIATIAEAFPDMQQSVLMEVIHVLFAANILHKATDIEKISPECRTTSQRFNKQICERTTKHGIAYRTLASPVIGGGVMVTTVEIFFLMAIHEGHTEEADYVQWTYDTMQERGMKMRNENKPMTEEETMNSLKESGENFAKHRLHFLRALGVELAS